MREVQGRSAAQRASYALLALVVGATSLLAPGAAHAERRTTQRELDDAAAATAAAFAGRGTLSAEELAVSPGLRATPDHVVMLHLEPGGRHIEHDIPFVFPRTRSFRFCIPREERHIRSLTVLRDDSPAVVLRIPRGAPCLTRTLEAGFYRLVVEHDGSDVPLGGRRAFLHVPRTRTGALTTEGAPAPTGFTCNVAYGDLQYTFTTPEGRYVNGYDNSNVTAEDVPDDLLAPGGWYICPDGYGNYTFSHLYSTFTATPPPSTSTAITAGVLATPTKFKLTDLGDGQFTLSANFGGQLYPIVVGPDNIMRWTNSGSPTVFTIVLRTQVAQGTPVTLGTGQAAFYQYCNAPATYASWTFYRGVPSLVPFTGLGSTVDNTFLSLATGPATAAVIYADADHGGASQITFEPLSCIGGALAGTVSSLEVLPTREFLVKTLECRNCNLSGADLSGLDLSGGQFQGSTFTGANLTNTIFQSANLDGANLDGASTNFAGTDFLGALVHCTNFRGAVLASASFQISGVIKPIVTTDFSCRLDLTGATIGVGTFPLTQWRYFDMTGVTVNGLTAATLSTTSSPLNLSGGVFNHTVLSSAKLDGANLGCATTPSGAKVCTQLIDSDLISATLRKANFAGSVLQGTLLDKANLDGATLCGAHLNQSPFTARSARLEGAFLHNANLAQSDLTGATLKNADFYSTKVGTCGSNSCNPTACASAVNAILTKTVFTDAYLGGVDFSGSFPQTANFSGAFLPGAIFSKANLSEDPGSGSATLLESAYLQGTSFANATVKDASFKGAYVDFASAGGYLYLLLKPENLQFTGHTTPAGSTPGCVLFDYSNHPTVTPSPADPSIICPDGHPGQAADSTCTTPQWTSAGLPPAPAGCSSFSDLDSYLKFPPQ